MRIKYPAFFEEKGHLITVSFRDIPWILIQEESKYEAEIKATECLIEMMDICISKNIDFPLVSRKLPEEVYLEVEFFNQNNEIKKR